VLEPDVYDPELNPLYADLMKHYGVVAMPCRVNHPDRKGKVERGVGYAQETALKGKRFESLEEAQECLDRWEERWASTRIHGTTKRQVSAAFAEERASLRPLPIEPFRYYRHAKRTVRAATTTDELLRLDLEVAALVAGGAMRHQRAQALRQLLAQAQRAIATREGATAEDESLYLVTPQARELAQAFDRLGNGWRRRWVVEAGCPRELANLASHAFTWWSATSCPRELANLASHAFTWWSATSCPLYEGGQSVAG